MTPAILKPMETQLQASSSDISQLPGRKRKNDDDKDNVATITANGCIPPFTTEPPSKIAKIADVATHGKNIHDLAIISTYSAGTTASTAHKKARETRLEQNRKAARESRRRKKVMIEDLQRSVIFFSRANGALKHQNDELTRLLMQAQVQVSIIESNTNTMKNTPAKTTMTSTISSVNVNVQQGNQHHQSITGLTDNESQKPHPSSNEVRMPAQASSATPLPPPAVSTTYPPVPAMQPGATMQAMASFQQAAAAAMQVAVQGMQGISPGASITSLAQPAPATGSASAQQAYNDTMTALAMQQAAIAAAAVPPHLVAQIVGSSGWVTASAPTSVAPAIIFPATTTQATSTTPTSTKTHIVGVTGTTNLKGGAIAAPVAPMPLSVATSSQGSGES